MTGTATRIDVETELAAFASGECLCCRIGATHYYSPACDQTHGSFKMAKCNYCDTVYNVEQFEKCPTCNLKGENL